MVCPLSQNLYDLIDKHGTAEGMLDRLKEAIVVLFPRKGDLHLTDNYLDISLIRICCEILTKAMANYIS